MLALLTVLACGGASTAPPPAPASATPSPSVAPVSSGDCGGQAPPKAGGGLWQCSWSDEFDGPGLDPVWQLIPYGLGSSCLFDDAEYAQVAEGELRLTARPLPPDHWCTVEYGLEYGGGGLQTQGGFAQQYGRFEARIQMPPGAGFWPAFWLLPDDESFDGEIDIAEAYGGRGPTVDSTLHVPAAGPGPQGICPVEPDYSAGFHVYTLEWEPDRMRFFYDGRLCVEFTGWADDGTAPPTLSGSFNKPYHVLLNLAVQPFWPPDDSTPFPGVMRVDHVRVWR
ncbi:MAG: glycoside hydrolase family 16 protein [Pseudonocardia sp.]